MILGARGIALGAAEAPKSLQPLARLITQQVLDGVENRTGMRLYGDSIRP